MEFAMVEIECLKDQIELKPNPIFKGIGLGAIVMSFVGFNFIFGMLPFEADYTAGDYFGFAFVCVWITVVLTIGFTAFKESSKMVIINDEGVLLKSFLGNRFLAWSEIADFGISYCGQTRGSGNTYDLYFSEKIHPVKNECSKILRGKMIKITINGNWYSDIVYKVMPYCREKTTVTPFVGKHKYHFI
jgi:hypothetical protein